MCSRCIFSSRWVFVCVWVWLPDVCSRFILKMVEALWLSRPEFARSANISVFAPFARIQFENSSCTSHSAYVHKAQDYFHVIIDIYIVAYFLWYLCMHMLCMWVCGCGCGWYVAAQPHTHFIRIVRMHFLIFIFFHKQIHTRTHTVYIFHDNRDLCLRQFCT